MNKGKLTKLKNFLTTHKKIVWISGASLLVLILIATLVLPLFGKGISGSQMETTTISLGSITETVDTYGVLEARPSVTLKWKSDGVVADFDLEVGDEVQINDVLLDLTPASQSTEILNAYSDLLEAETELELLTTTDADYQDILADLVYQEKMLINKKADKLAWNYGQSSMERIDAVHDNYYAARAEVWELEEAYDEVKSLDEDDPVRAEAYEALEEGKVKRDSLKRALNQILGIQFDIAVETDFIEYDQQAATVAEARVAYNRYVDQSEEIGAAQATVQSYQNLVNQAKIISPIDGTITSISVVTGDVVEQGAEVVQVDNLENMVVEVNISQADINKIEIGQLAVMSFDAISKKEYTGFVQTISADGTEDSNGVVQFTAEIKIEDADENVKPGFTAVVNIVVEEAEETLLVANQAVISQEDGSYAVAIVDAAGGIEMIAVETGAESDVYTEIISDEIEEGDQVAILATVGTANGNGPGMGMMGRGGGTGVFQSLLGGGGR